MSNLPSFIVGHIRCSEVRMQCDAQFVSVLQDSLYRARRQRLCLAERRRVDTNTVADGYNDDAARMRRWDTECRWVRSGIANCMGRQPRRTNAIQMDITGKLRRLGSRLRLTHCIKQPGVLHDCEESSHPNSWMRQSGKNVIFRREVHVSLIH